VDNQKRVEQIYFNEARHASDIFPKDVMVQWKPFPDFRSETRGFGIEMTELCRPNERAEGARLSYISPKAKAIYRRLPGAKPVSVSPVLSHEADQMHVNELATSLATFVHSHQDANANLSWHEHRDMPKGFSQIGVFPRDLEPEGKWRHFRAFNVGSVTKELIDSRIAEKNKRIADYRAELARHHAGPPEAWLLIVNDLFLGPGEVSVRLEGLARWTFDFAFDKVLLFERQPGGSGKVIELRRD
jgi:hypothetical protein